jgi:thioredoxin-related protein
MTYMFNKETALIFFFFILAIPSSFAQLTTHSFEEVEQFSKENPKPIVVFIHTSWCKYCKMMENSTFKNPKVIKELNENFYFISLDAESKKEITFHNHTFRFKPTGNNTGIHELATALATIDSQVIYPTLSILNADYTITLQKHSYLNAKSVLSILEKKK